MNLLEKIKSRIPPSRADVSPGVSPVASLGEKPHISEPPELNSKVASLASLPEPGPGSPADCEHCPACARWDYQEFSGKRLCFHRAYFLGRAGRPVDIVIQRRNCPLLKPSMEGTNDEKSH